MATKNEKNTDQIRQLVNKVHLAGALAELEVKEGQTQTGVPYLSLNGAIQCGESAVSTVRFRSFIKAFFFILDNPFILFTICDINSCFTLDLI